MACSWFLQVFAEMLPTFWNLHPEKVQPDIHIPSLLGLLMCVQHVKGRLQIMCFVVYCLYTQLQQKINMDNCLLWSEQDPTAHDTQRLQRVRGEQSTLAYTRDSSITHAYTCAWITAMYRPWRQLPPHPETVLKTYQNALFKEQFTIKH